MARAEQLLHADPGIRPAAFCEAVDCHDTVQFIRDFKAQYGMSQAKNKQVKAAGTPPDETSRCFLHLNIRMFWWMPAKGPFQRLGNLLKKWQKSPKSFDEKFSVPKH